MVEGGDSTNYYFESSSVVASSLCGNPALIIKK
jgi:hypothetical protein